MPWTIRRKSNRTRAKGRPFYYYAIGTNVPYVWIIVSDYRFPSKVLKMEKKFDARRLMESLRANDIHDLHRYELLEVWWS